MKFNTDIFELDQYMHIAATYNGSVAKIFVNGELKESQAYSTPLTSSTNVLYIGANKVNTKRFVGFIDELRVSDIAKSDDDIKQDYQRILNGTELGTVASWGFDEGQSNFIFDCSKTGNNFNKNHGNINGATWSSTIPSESQLSYMGITAADGTYSISGIRYAFAGENFKLTPVFNTHEFEPASRVIFIGEGSNIHNNQDFEDISAFEVTGKVKYAGTSCFAKDILIAIDGTPVLKNGQAVMTDNNGDFSIMVPIGEHQISVFKNGHEFSAGIYPPTGYHDFQEPVYGIEFIDTTLITVVGRVVGGLEQSSKSPVLGRCTNNIGSATINFETQSACFTTNITTTDTSGQFIIKLPPMKYIIPDFSINSDPIIQFQNNDLLDLSINSPIQQKIDTIFVEGTDIVKRIDSVEFHNKLDFVYRSFPEMSVHNNDGISQFSGNESFTYTAIDETEVEIILNPNPFPFDVFTQAVVYEAKISAYEVYTNKDAGAGNFAIDTVPVTAGNIMITNELAQIESTVIQMSGGDTIYTFRAGKPNTILNGVTPLYDYTKTFQISIETGPNTVHWKPLSPAKGEYYRAYILGSRSADGQSFVTNGPQKVDVILRDPPGSNSTATIEEGKTITTTESYSLGAAYTASAQASIKAGTEFTAGMGFATDTKLTTSVKAGINIEAKVTNSGEFQQTLTVTESKETNGDPDAVGAMSDLFMGKSVNVEFGLANNISIVAQEVYDLPNVEEAGTIVNIDGVNYSFAKRKTLMIVPGGYDTYFIYDRNHIQNYLLPNLIELRNQFFLLQPTIYVSYLGIENEKYGTNNDDPIWETLVTTDDPVNTAIADYDGESYKYIKIEDEDIDSIRVFNQQIRLWQEALALDEEEKAFAIEGGVVEKNISFNAGPTYEYSHESGNSWNNTTEVELNVTQAFAVILEAEIAGVGVEVESGVSIGLESAASFSYGEETTTTFSYTLNDGDQGDFFTVDVYDGDRGNGPIFYTRAGQSSCPFEKGFNSEYYEPGTPLSLPTLQREVPTISVLPSLLTNIPSTEAAAFNITLGNESESGDDMVYVVKVMESTNPHGAIIKMDGIAVTREIMVPGGSSVQKILTVEKGPGSVYDYDSLAIIIHSPCQYAAGTADDDDIVDITYFSAHFLPTCSDIQIINPDNQWVVNNSFNDTLNTILADYNINFPGLEEIKFWYKPTSQASWIGLETWYKDTTGMNNPNLNLISENNAYSLYEWDLQQINDGFFDIKTSTKCTLADVESEIFSGIIDRINPHPFGNPSPANGILSPNDNIMIQFNEEIDLGLLSSDNFSITGVLNGTDLRHDGYLYFDGINDNVEIANGLSLNNSFSIEFWIKRDNINLAETIISQGINENQHIAIGFDNTNKIKFNVENMSMSSNISFNLTCSFII